MNIKDIIRASLEQSKEIPEKLAQKYKEHLGEEMVKKQEKLTKLEAELYERKKVLDERKKLLDQREATLNRYYQVPKWAIVFPLSLAIFAGLFLHISNYNHH